VFLEAWCVRTRMRLGWQMIPGGRCLCGGYGDVLMACMCTVFGVGGGVLLSLFAFFVFLHRNEHFYTHVPRERHCATAHHWLRIETRLSGYVIEKCMENPSQMFYNVSG
jgi:hypothetical protein